MMDRSLPKLPIRDLTACGNFRSRKGARCVEHDLVVPPKLFKVSQRANVLFSVILRDLTKRSRPVNIIEEMLLCCINW
jgi:hypothetical protein